MAQVQTHGLLSALPLCAQNCISSAISQSPCTSPDISCLCMGNVFHKAVNCAAHNCGVKGSLGATNFTMFACKVPQTSQVNTAPIVAGILGPLALIMVIIRIWQRTVFKQAIGLDDVLTIAAMLCAIPLNCMAFFVAGVGLGDNIWTIPFDNITRLFKFLYVAEVFYMPSEAFTQLSFIFFFRRAFPTRDIYWTAHALTIVSIFFGVSNTLVMIFQCAPVDFTWKSWTGEFNGACIGIKGYSWYKAAMQITIDLFIFSLPIRPLMGLSLSRKKKARIFFMFCSGFLATVISCLRLQSLIKFANSRNPTYDNAPAVFWSIAECDIAIISACMPFLPSLLQRFFPSVFGEVTVWDSGSTVSGGAQQHSASIDSMAKGIAETWPQENDQA